MPPPISLAFQPDENELGELQGAYAGPIRADTPFKTNLNYTLLTPIEVHGKANIDGQDKDASLIGFQLLNSQESHERRIKQIIVDLKFFYDRKSGDNTAPPNVVGMEPEKPPILLEYVREEHHKAEKIENSAEGSAGGSAGGAELSAKVGRRKEESDEFTKFFTFAATISGSRIRSRGRDMKYADSVKWIANESPIKPDFDGVPPDIRCTLLLIRPTTGNFSCRIKVHTEVDWRHKLKEFAHFVKTWKVSTTAEFDINDYRSDVGDIKAGELGDFFANNGQKLKDLVDIQMSKKYKEYKSEASPGTSKT